MKILNLACAFFVLLFASTLVDISAQQLSIEHDSDVPSLSPHIQLIETDSTDWSRLWFQNAASSTTRWAVLARPAHPTNKEIAMAYNGVPKWRLTEDGVMVINDLYSFPNTQGTSSQTLVFSKTVPGQLEWAFPRIMQSENTQAGIGFGFGDEVIFQSESQTTMIIDYTDGVEINTDLIVEGTLEVDGVTLGPDGFGVMAVNAPFRPTGNGTHSLGTLANRWKNVFAANGVIQTSDARMKKNVETIPYGLNTVLKMKPVSYNWNEENNSDKKHLGLMAQELLKITPEVVHQSEDKQASLGVKYTELIPVLVKAIQEQQKQINAQSIEIKRLISNSK